MTDRILRIASICKNYDNFTYIRYKSYSPAKFDFYTQGIKIITIMSISQLSITLSKIHPKPPTQRQNTPPTLSYLPVCNTSFPPCLPMSIPLHSYFFALILVVDLLLHHRRHLLHRLQLHQPQA